MNITYRLQTRDPCGTGTLKEFNGASKRGSSPSLVILKRFLLTAEFLDGALRQSGEMPAEPAIQPDIGFIRGDGLLGGSHAETWGGFAGNKNGTADKIG